MPYMKSWWFSEYEDDILESLHRKEQQRVKYLGRSPELSYRKGLVKGLCKAAESLKLSNTAVHLGIYLLDIFMDNHGIAVESLNLVGLVSLILAAKFVEVDHNIPNISELNSYVDNSYLPYDYILMEFKIMQFFKWNIMIPTAVEFVEYYVVFATSQRDLGRAPRFTYYEELQNSVQQHVKNFLDQSLLDEYFLRITPSVTAAACVAAARILAGITKRWSAKLQKVTRYKFEDLEICVYVLLRNSPEGKITTKKRKFQESLDLGYATGGSTTSSPESYQRQE